MADRIDLTEVRRMAEGVTPAPWQHGTISPRGHYVDHDNNQVADVPDGADAAFIAYARNHWSAVLDELEELRAFARDIRDNYDCDDDAHRHGTTCRACEAEKVLDPQAETR